MRRATWLVSFVLASAMIGCQGTGQIQGGIRRTSVVSKVISLSPGTSEIIALNAGSNLLKGRTESDNFPDAIMKTIPVVASVKPDAERIKTIDPEVIVYDSLLYSKEEIEKVKGKAEVLSVRGNTIDEFENDLKEIAKVVGNETQFSSYIDKIEQARNEAKGAPINPKPKVVVLMPSGSGADYWLGTKSFLADAVRCGGGDVVGPNAERFVPLNVEMLVSLNPDTIVIPVDREKAKPQVDAVLNNPKLQTVSAIKNRKIVGLDADVALRRGGRVDKLISSVYRGLAGKK